MPLPEDLRAGAARPAALRERVGSGVLDDAGVRTATGVQPPDLERLAGRAARIGLPATGSGARRPTIPS